MRQNQPAGDDAHNAFKTQDQRSHGRIDAALADDLKRVGDAVAADAGVKEGGSSGFHGVQRGRFEGHHQNQPQKTADKKLNATHAHAVNVIRVVVNDENVCGVTERAGKHKSVAKAKRKLSRRHAQVVEAQTGKHNCNPDQKTRFASDEHPHDGNDDDIQARQETRFSHRCV